MMTKLRQDKRAQKIGEKRRKRRLSVKHKGEQKGVMIKHMRKTLQTYIESQPKREPIRAGKKTLGSRIKSLFRKPTV